MSEQSSKDSEFDLFDKSMATITIIALIALLIGEDSIDSARPVFIAGVIVGISSLIIRFIRRRRNRKRSKGIDKTENNTVKQDLVNIKGNDSDIQKEIENNLNMHSVVDHDNLIGVNELIENTQAFLTNPNDGWIISLFGEGGVGKTAVAYEAVKRYAAIAGFTRFAWVSAKQRYFSSTGQVVISSYAQEWAELVGGIGHQLGLEMGYSRSSWPIDFQERIRELPSWERCLIVIDNLETIADANVIEYFDNQKEPTKRIIKPHKVLVTTRNSILAISHNAVELPLIGLPSKSAYELTRYLGRGNSEIAKATDDKLKPIISITEGNPLLIKLIVRRFLVSRKPLDEVLTELKPQLKEYLYVQSLQALESEVGGDAAKQIMNAFCPILPGETATYERLRNYSGINDGELFDDTLRVACDLALIRVSGSFDRKYSIHSLLWEFTCK